MASFWQSNATIQTRRGIHFHNVADLLALLVLVYGATVLLLLPLPLLRLPLGLMLVLFAPGYTLQATLFARKHDLDNPARIGVSIGLSVAVLPLIAIALDQLPWGIRLWPIVSILLGWITTFSALAIARRWQVGAHDAAASPIAGRHLRSSLLFAGIAVLILVVTGMSGITLVQTTATTEFFVTGAQGMAEEYPREVVAGETMQVNLGISNQEGRSLRYRVEVRSGTQTLTSIPAIEVGQGATWEQPLQYALPQSGNDQIVDVLLLREQDQQPYRRLRLWVNVREQQP